MSEQFLHGVEVVQIDDGIRPIRTVKSSIIGIVGTADDADAALFPLNKPVLVTGPRMAAALGLAGTLADAYTAIYAKNVAVAVVVRVAEGVDAAATLANAVGTAAAQSGAFALLGAVVVTGQTPRILCAPGLSAPDAPGTKNPLVTALETVATKLRAVVIADGPGTVEADAITYAGLFGSDRTYIVDPGVQVFDPATASYVTRPGSGYVAGIISFTDNEKGFWWSPSNKLVNGVAGIARPVSFALSDPDTEANRLNAANVATFVQSQGFRLWGNRTTSSDPMWSFLSVRRTADMIYDSIEQQHLWAMDRPFSAQLLLDIRDGVQAYLDRLIALGALLGGRVWLDPELNSQTTLASGQLYLDFDIEPPAALEHLTFRAHRNGDYYEELVAEIANAS